MQVSYTQHTLDKLEDLLKALEYRVRYEKGNFKTGACLLDKSRVIVINKFSNLENRIIALIDLLQQIPVDEALLEDKQKARYYQLKQTQLEL